LPRRQLAGRNTGWAEKQASDGCGADERNGGKGEGGSDKRKCHQWGGNALTIRAYVWLKLHKKKRMTNITERANYGDILVMRGKD